MRGRPLWPIPSASPLQHFVAAAPPVHAQAGEDLLLHRWTSRVRWRWELEVGI